jgi:hypothetical protein
MAVSTVGHVDKRKSSLLERLVRRLPFGRLPGAPAAPCNTERALSESALGAARAELAIHERRLQASLRASPFVAHAPSKHTPSARELLATVIGSACRDQIAAREIAGPMLFSVRTVGADQIVELNTSHPLGARLGRELCFDNDAEVPEHVLAERYLELVEIVRVLLLSWAEYESELTGVGLQRARDVREDWGRVARRRHGSGPTVAMESLSPPPRDGVPDARGGVGYTHDGPAGLR